MTLIQVCVSSDDDSGELIHNEYRWNDTSFVSPLHSNQIVLGSGSGLIVSQYSFINSPQGAGIIPADGATVDVRSNRILSSGDDFDFNTAQHELLFLRSSTLYSNNTTDITNLLAAATQITPVTGGPNLYQGSFTMPTSTDEYLYLIYDYRDKQQVTLCYSSTSLQDSCCGC